jgi:hypothetical protein
MANDQDYYKFRLTGGRTPASSNVPLKDIMIERMGENGISRGFKKIEYIKGHESMWKEDHIGDEKPGSIWFEYGLLKVHKGNKALLEILFKHKWYNHDYELIDENTSAIKELTRFEKIEQALDKVNISNDDERKANALILIGPGVIDWSPERVKAGLKQKAFENAPVLLEEMAANDYHAKYIAAHALLAGVVVINPSRTGVTWPNGNTIVSCPAGQDPIFKLGEFLSGNDDQAKITLQEIGEKTTRAYVTKDIPKVKEAVKKVKEIKEEEEEEEEDNEPRELTEEEIEKNEELKRLADATMAYFNKFNKKVPAPYKNKVEWIESKLVEE